MGCSRPESDRLLELHDRTGQLVKLEPHALWIIGNNGRVDVKRDGRRFLIVDAADNFEEPDWQVARDERSGAAASPSRAIG